MFFPEGVAAVGTKVNAFEALLLCLAFMVAGFLGSYFYSYLGWWGMLPAIMLGLVLAILACAGIVNAFLEARRARRGKKESTGGP
jgi:MFS family permease